MDLCPFLITLPPTTALKKLAKLNSTRTMRTGEEMTAGERYQRTYGSQKVCGQVVTMQWRGELETQ